MPPGWMLIANTTWASRLKVEHRNVSFTNNVVQNFWGTYSVGTSKATNVVITGNTFKNCEYYGVQLGETGGTSSVTNNTFIDCDYGSEDGGANTLSDENQTIQSNKIQVGPNGGTGENKTQNNTVGDGTLGSVMMSCGLACSGGCSNTSEYIGVTCSGNTVSGAGSIIYGPPGSAFLNGATETGNTCNNGCSYR